MSFSYIQPAYHVVVAATSVVKGQYVESVSIRGVAMGNAGAGDTVQLAIRGRFEFEVSEAVTAGQKAYVNSSGKIGTSGNFVGVAMELTGNGQRQMVDLFVMDTLSGSAASIGIADYNDSATSSSPISLAANTWTTITNNGAGAFSNLDYLPTGVTGLLDTGTGQFDFSELSLGDYVVIRNDYTVTPSTNNALLELRYQLGAGGSAYTLEKTVARLDSGSGVAYRQNLGADFIYMGDGNTRDNPVTMQVRLSSAGSLVNAGTAFGVNRR